MGQSAKSVHMNMQFKQENFNLKTSKGDRECYRVFEWLEMERRVADEGEECDGGGDWEGGKMKVELNY